jgi:hypothetical protein
MDATLIDRTIWKRSGEGFVAVPILPWKFSDSAINVGMRDVHVRPQLLFPLAWFDVFSTSVYLSSGLSEGERRLKLYYLMLRKELEMHLENVPEGVELDRCPSCIWPWLWRTSLGYFSHDDVDHSNMMKSGQQHEVDLSAKKFPATCEWQKRA